MGTLLMPHEFAILTAMGKLSAERRAVGSQILKAAGIRRADIEGKFKNALTLMDCRGYVRWSDAEGTHGAYVVTKKGADSLEYSRSMKARLRVLGFRSAQISGGGRLEQARP